jgi:RNA polymerase sigma factor (sigma-70 family)
VARPPRRLPALSPEQQELAGSYLPLAIKLSRRFAHAYGLDREEMRSVAFETLVTAATSYEPGRCPASTYFYAKIVQGFLDWMRHSYREKRAGRPLLFSAYKEPDEALGLTDGGQQIEDIEIREFAETLLSRAQGQEGDILRACYLDGRTHVEVARSLGIRASRVNFLKRGGLSRLRWHLGLGTD